MEVEGSVRIEEAAGSALGLDLGAGGAGELAANREVEVVCAIHGIATLGKRADPEITRDDGARYAFYWVVDPVQLETDFPSFCRLSVVEWILQRH